MKKLLLVLTFITILISQRAIAHEDTVMVDGVEHDQVEVIEIHGLSSQGVSPTNKARIYYDSEDDKVKLSENGGAYVDITSGGGAVEGTAVLSTGEGGGTKYLREDGDGTSSWQTPAGAGDLLADGTVPMTANWDIGNYDITLKSLTGDGTIEGATLTEGGNAVYNSTETPGGSLGGTWSSPTIDDLFLKLGGDVATAGAYDFGGASFEVPNSASLPGTCTVGQVYMDTDATSGQRVYACETTNNWVLQGDGGDSTTGGRSTTLNGSAIDADAELYTDTKGIYFEDPVAADDFKSIFYAKQALTITSIWAESDQTVTFMIQIDDGTPADVDTVDLAPAAGTAEDTSLNGDVTMAAGDRLDLDLVSVSGTPTWVSIMWTFTYDD